MNFALPLRSVSQTVAPQDAGRRYGGTSTQSLQAPFPEQTGAAPVLPVAIVPGMPFTPRAAG